MELSQFARSLLFGTTLEEKLLSPALHETTGERLTDAYPGEPLSVPPAFPGRPPELGRSAKAKFPDLSEIHRPKVRGEILHFFANHELLALEIMALVLLRFPEAPAAFRQGVARTILEEQGHLRLYLKRMNELGVGFGDIPVNDYFWKVLSPMRSPMDYVVQMSLTFEQANLDFSLFYRDQVAKTGDVETTAILDQVYREEIGHVKHGLIWFNRWREEAKENDWDAYRRLLPPPLTPLRAKGRIFDEESRRLAGLSARFIRELALHSGSKGRPPVLWLYNPFCDSEIARGKPGFNPKSNLQNLALDLEHVPMFLASPQDTVLVTEKPSLDWLSTLKEAGFDLPDWGSSNPGALTEPKFGGIEPWGWSPEVHELFKPLKSRLVETSGGNARWVGSLLNKSRFAETGLSEIFSKAWSVRYLERWMSEHPTETESWGAQNTAGTVFNDWESARSWLEQSLLSGLKIAAKAPWSTSGNGVRRVLNVLELDSSLGGWIRNTIETQNSVVLEPWLDKIHDLSIQIEVDSQRVRILEARKFITGRQLEYRGTCLGPLKAHFDSSSLKLLSHALESWKMFARDLGAELRSLGYEGPAGLDAMIFKRPSGELGFKPLVELNPRWTMGRVALSLEERLAPGVPGFWAFLPVREITARYGFLNVKSAVQSWTEQYPVKTIEIASRRRIASGVLPTQDPGAAREVMTLLISGEDALSGLGASNSTSNSSSPLLSERPH